MCGKGETFVSPLINNVIMEVPVTAQWLTNLTNIQEDTGLIPGLDQWVYDPALLWLWYRPAATAPIQLLAWEPAYALGADLKRQKKNNNNNVQLWNVSSPKEADSDILKHLEMHTL